MVLLSRPGERVLVPSASERLSRSLEGGLIVRDLVMMDGGV